jgi:hypothetical protein
VTCWACAVVVQRLKVCATVADNLHERGCLFNRVALTVACVTRLPHRTCCPCYEGRGVIAMIVCVVQDACSRRHPSVAPLPPSPPSSGRCHESQPTVPTVVKMPGSSDETEIFTTTGTHAILFHLRVARQPPAWRAPPFTPFQSRIVGLQVVVVAVCCLCCASLVDVRRVLRVARDDVRSIHSYRRRVHHNASVCP